MSSVPPDDRHELSHYDYTREQIQQVRKDFNDRLDHESRYRKQYGEMAAEAMQALSEKGWVNLKLTQLSDDVAEVKRAQKEDMADMKRSQNRIFATAFALLVSTLTLLVTVIFGILTRGAP
jgi:hypothetical protein